MESSREMDPRPAVDRPPTEGIATQLGNDAGAVADTAQDILARAKEEGAEQLAAVKDQAQEALHKVGDEARTFATEHKDAAGTQLENVADAIAEAADTLEDRSGPVVAGYARDLAGGLKQVSSTVKSRNVEEIVGMVQDFGKQQPLAFLGAAALAGFVASRFMLSSAERANAGGSGRAGGAGGSPAASGSVPTSSWQAGQPLREQGEL